MTNFDKNWVKILGYLIFYQFWSHFFAKNGQKKSFYVWTPIDCKFQNEFNAVYLENIYRCFDQNSDICWWKIAI